MSISHINLNQTNLQTDSIHSFKKAGRSDAYYRFDVDRGLELVHLNESDEKSLQHISSVTKAYLNSRADDLERCALKINIRTCT